MRYDILEPFDKCIEMIQSGEIDNVNSYAKYMVELLQLI